MKSHNFFYDSSNNRSLIFTQLWEPDSQPVGIIQFIHGTFEHSGKYKEAAEFFTRFGFICACHDHLGHGLSAADDYGFFGYNHGAEYIIEDIKSLTYQLKEKFPNLPLILCGFSMGAFLLQILLSQDEYIKEAAGCIFAGAAGITEKVDKILKQAKNSLSKNGPKNIDRKLNIRLFKLFEEAFPHEEDSLSWLTALQSRRDSYRNDSHAFKFLTNAALRDFLVLLEMSQTQQTIQGCDTRIPLLFVSGKDDAVSKFTIQLRNLVNEYINTGVTDLTLRIFTKVRHDVLYDFPATQNQSLPFIKNWILARIQND